MLSFKMSYSQHPLLLLSGFVCLTATSPTPDAGERYTSNAQGRPRLVPSLLTRSSVQCAPKPSPIARDLYELPKGWVRTLWDVSLEQTVQSFGYKSVLQVKFRNLEEDMFIPGFV